MKNKNKQYSQYINKIFSLFLLLSVVSFGCNKKTNHFDVTHDFDFIIEDFLNPDSEFKPFTRWWWPGNDVNSDRLREEIRILAEMNFGGVEIQPFTTGINPETKREDFVYSWDDESFYNNVKVVLDEAILNNIKVDLNAGSGWPMGGPFVDKDESILTLDIADTIVQGRGSFNLPIPKIKIDKIKKVERRNKEYSEIYNELSYDDYKLITVICGKVKQFRDTQVVLYDSLIVADINDSDEMVSLQFDDEAKYAVIAIYIRPSAEKPLYIATKDESWVTDMLDEESIEHSLKHLFGSRTGFEQYYGKPLRAIFFDSKEYITDRHVSKDFISYFKKNRGYDITPWLFTNAIEGYDNAYSFGRDTIPKFVINENDRRFRYDYNKTISELFSERTCKFTSEWLEKKGLLHRSQSYGMRADIISASGNTSIPEAEQLSGGGGDGFVKLITSGAILYNKPIVSQEAFVFAGKTYMTTPQKLKVFSNKAFAAGVNQLVYHGTAYQYMIDDYGEEGWYPWATPFRTFNYSSNINETNPYWEYIDDVNLYIAKMQYALRSGKPNVDVLVYFPFTDFEASQVIRNPNELIFNGSYTEEEPYYNTSLGSYVENPTLIQNWFMETWKLLNLIESSGLTWNFVNDESLLAASLNRYNNIEIRGNEFQSLVVANLPHINLEIAEKISSLTKNNAKILFQGDLPANQPGYLNYKQNEEKIKEIFESLELNKSKFKFSKSFDDWFAIIDKPISFKDRYEFIKLQSRKMSDGSMLKYLWNQSDVSESITLELNNNNLKYNYLIYPEKNEIVLIQDRENTIQLNPFEAVLLYSSMEKNIDSKYFNDRIEVKDTVATLIEWSAKTDSFVTPADNLKNLSTMEDLAVGSGKIEYETSFNLNLDSQNKFMIDLGKVYYTTDVYVNDSHVGQTIWSPHQLDISEYLINGENEIKVIVQPTKRNKYVYEALNGNKDYIPFKRNEPLMPFGLFGPVKIVKF